MVLVWSLDLDALLGIWTIVNGLAFETINDVRIPPDWQGTENHLLSELNETITMTMLNCGGCQAIG
jgi:hypothetical protein